MSVKDPLNPWNYKPWWCQPWSILLTGVVIITGSWVLAKTLWITLIVTTPILVWWFYFLWLWPRLLRLSSLELMNRQPAQESESSETIYTSDK
ncbi:MAG: DUF6737 family protein [Coleofasciculus sp. G1-WW12-02]|uniref:DUF6737 family protein n=1 Tax=Coleofasciculus sp. G1-WW12-02 TaxID=3068483 RepID=UPI0032FAEF06